MENLVKPQANISSVVVHRNPDLPRSFNLVTHGVLGGKKRTVKQKKRKKRRNRKK